MRHIRLIGLVVSGWHIPCTRVRANESTGVFMVAMTETISEQSDRDLERRVTNYLAGRHVPGLRHLEVEASNGMVTVKGRVYSFYEKQLCQAVCRRVAGVVGYIDAVDVSYLSARSHA
jgi:osmotically-inducible protein OsmY